MNIEPESMSERLENFERAFSDGSAGCRRTCHCGKLYFDNANSYDWEVGELECLRANKNAVALEYAPGDISFEGNTYVDVCPCWHKRAQQIMVFLDSHGHKISKLFALEKLRKQRIADSAPTIEQ